MQRALRRAKCTQLPLFPEKRATLFIFLDAHLQISHQPPLALFPCGLRSQLLRQLFAGGGRRGEERRGGGRGGHAPRWEDILPSLLVRPTTSVFLVLLCQRATRLMEAARLAALNNSLGLCMLCCCCCLRCLLTCRCVCLFAAEVQRALAEAERALESSLHTQRDLNEVRCLSRTNTLCAVWRSFTRPTRSVWTPSESVSCGGSGRRMRRAGCRPPAEMDDAFWCNQKIRYSLLWFAMPRGGSQSVAPTTHRTASRSGSRKRHRLGSLESSDSDSENLSFLGTKKPFFFRVRNR